MGLLDEHDEKMRLYFLNNEKSLTADEKTHFILLNKMIFHRVCDLAEYGSDNKDVIETHDVQPYVGKNHTCCSLLNFGYMTLVVG